MKMRLIPLGREMIQTFPDSSGLVAIDSALRWAVKTLNFHIETLCMGTQDSKNEGETYPTW